MQRFVGFLVLGLATCPQAALARLPVVIWPEQQSLEVAHRPQALFAPLPDGLPDQADQLSCVQAGNAAEQEAGLPSNILVSIGMVESGRADVAGYVTPWPWTVNIDGAGHYFASKAAAVAYTRLAESSGAGDIDVGCFQISLQNHPDAFDSLETAFNPTSNANYAAGYLNRLKAQTGSWNTAIADYHSALPDLGLPYQRLVLAAWRGLGNAPAEFAPQAAGNLTMPDFVVIKMTTAAKSAQAMSIDGAVQISRRPGLPMVISP